MKLIIYRGQEWNVHVTNTKMKTTCRMKCVHDILWCCGTVMGSCWIRDIFLHIPRVAALAVEQYYCCCGSNPREDGLNRLGPKHNQHNETKTCIYTGIYSAVYILEFKCKGGKQTVLCKLNITLPISLWRVSMRSQWRVWLGIIQTSVSSEVARNNQVRLTRDDSGNRVTSSSCRVTG